MLRSSDDSAAQNFWDRSGGNAVIARVKSRYGLAGTTAPYNGHWDVTTEHRKRSRPLLRQAAERHRWLPPEQANIIIGNLAQSTPTGNDGYPQRFGIPEGLYAEPVAVKQGWFCCWSGPNQLHVSTGVIGADRRYVMAISSLDPTSEAAARGEHHAGRQDDVPGRHDLTGRRGDIGGADTGEIRHVLHELDAGAVGIGQVDEPSRRQVGDITEHRARRFLQCAARGKDGLGQPSTSSTRNDRWVKPNSVIGLRSPFR